MSMLSSRACILPSTSMIFLVSLAFSNCLASLARSSNACSLDSCFAVQPILIQALLVSRQVTTLLLAFGLRLIPGAALRPPRTLTSRSVIVASLFLLSTLEVNSASGFLE